MASIPKSEYIGFTVDEKSRTYRLRVVQASGEEKIHALSISNRAFLDQRVRYQDAPAICFLKLERELLACGDGTPASKLSITDADLAEFRGADGKKTHMLRPHHEVKR